MEGVFRTWRSPKKIGFWNDFVILWSSLGKNNIFASRSGQVRLCEYLYCILNKNLIISNLGFFFNKSQII